MKATTHLRLVECEPDARPRALTWNWALIVAVLACLAFWGLVIAGAIFLL